MSKERFKVWHLLSLSSLETAIITSFFLLSISNY